MQLPKPPPPSIITPVCSPSLLRPDWHKLAYLLVGLGLGYQVRNKGRLFPALQARR